MYIFTRLYYYLKAWGEKQSFSDSLYGDRIDYMTRREIIRQLNRFYEDPLMSYVPVVSAMIIVHMQTEQISKKVINAYIKQTKYWINQMSDNNIKQDINIMTFEDALKSLEEIVSKLDSGEIDLDKAVEAYEMGTRLKEHCENKLKEAQLRIEKIEVDKDGELATKVMDIE